MQLCRALIRAIATPTQESSRIYTFADRMMQMNLSNPYEKATLPQVNRRPAFTCSQQKSKYLEPKKKNKKKMDFFNQKKNNKKEEFKTNHIKKIERFLYNRSKKTFHKKYSRIREAKNKNRTVIDPYCEIFNSSAPRILASNSFSKINKVGLPTLPPYRPQEQVKFRAQMFAWSVFTRWHIVKKELEIIANAKIIPTHLPMFVPTVQAYFYLLPIWARNNYAIRQLAILLDRYKPELSMEKKEIALNFVAFMLRPLPKYLKEYTNNLQHSRRTALTLSEGKQYSRDVKVPMELEDGGFGESLFEDDTPFLEHVLKRKRERESTPEGKAFKNLTFKEKIAKRTPPFVPDPNVTYGQFEYPQARIPSIDEEREKPVLFPLEYYINNDGFWNEYIEMKQVAMRKQKITMKRPFLKH